METKEFCMRPLRILFASLAAALALAADGVRADWLLQPDTERVRAGEPLDVIVYVVNDGTAPIEQGLPLRLPANARSAETAATLTLEAVDPPPDLAAPIAPGTFRKQRYRAHLPQTLRGTVQIALERLPLARLNVAVDAVDPPPATAASSARLQPEQTAGAWRMDTIAEPVLSPYEPMYFLIGGRGTDTARFQMSFKYRLFDERWTLAQLWPAISGIYFGYTQTSLWDIGSTSAPFRDTSYRPSLFYYDPQLHASEGGRFLLGVETGLEHESNGREGARSRSINIAYVKPAWRWLVGDEHYFSIAPKIYAYLDREDNPDIARYRGHVDMNLRYGKRDGWLFAATLRKGTADYGSIQLDASYPIRQPFFADAGGFLHFQYFNGYGETLLDYNERRSSQLRIGFSIVR
jgi:outer membrane phospholipase A